MRNELDLKVASHGLCIPPERCNGWRMLPGGLKARDGALCSAHKISNRILRQPSTRACLEHLVGELALHLQGFIRFSKALALGGAGDKSVMVMCDGLVLEGGHAASVQTSHRRRVCSE